MSTRILDVKVGERYEHHFMDDLESFFWLILWSVIQHVDCDPDGDRKHNVPAERAQELLDQLDRADVLFETLSGTKQRMLMRCRTNKIQQDLKECENAWAANTSILCVIKELGNYFAGLVVDDVPLLQYTPEVVFPKVVGILSEALQEMRPGS